MLWVVVVTDNLNDENGPFIPSRFYTFFFFLLTYFEVQCIFNCWRNELYFFFHLLSYCHFRNCFDTFFHFRFFVVDASQCHFYYG
jgi:hypothetical protein